MITPLLGASGQKNIDIRNVVEHQPYLLQNTGKNLALAVLANNFKGKQPELLSRFAHLVLSPRSMHQ